MAAQKTTRQVYHPRRLIIRDALACRAGDALYLQGHLILPAPVTCLVEGSAVHAQRRVMGPLRLIMALEVRLEDFAFLALL